MSRPTVYRRYRKLLPAVALSVFVLGFSDYGQADEASSYESYFGDEVTSASCGLSCIEEWVMKPTFRCQVEIDDQHNLKCKAVVSCEIVDVDARRAPKAKI